MKRFALFCVQTGLNKGCSQYVARNRLRSVGLKNAGYTLLYRGYSQVGDEKLRAT
jgi:hypothetical protein